MTASMINILDERLNGQDLRIINIERLTKEVHTAVQKYKVKSYEKVMADRFESLTKENQAFQETVRSKLLEITSIIEQKCKKAVTGVYESKLAKLEFDVKELTLY